ncbi:sulfurtransferase [Flavimaricola marinus]|uniref:Sulfurtransferase n=1 Tax=Flavimaricola marinus TaxID=1819565 RepID=A0A238LIP8_9RHOB|nr:sulfurtransferase [Flavimaricola marinus]SMY09521.1 Putative thiosulfate sulfurtransferase [Flavimaricola marinus]
MGNLVDTDWLAAHIDDPDLRLIQIGWEGLTAYEAGHIPGAVGWNWKAALWDPFERQFPTDADFCARMGAAGIHAGSTVVIYGVPVQFGTYAWWVLRLAGHADVRLLDGGQVKWEREGRPITTDRPEIAPVRYELGMKQPDLRAGRDDVLNALGDPDWLILDHRSAEEYNGERVGVPGKPDVGAERAGRIPGAVHLPFEALLNDDTSFRSREELAEIVGAHVGDADQKIICYCRLSHRATLASFAMTELLGFRNVRVYDGSWTEWGSMVGMPIERD